MPNVEAHIKAHNQKVIKVIQPDQILKCNCRNEIECPLQGNCLIKSIVYRGNITTTNEKDESNYKGMTENHF